MTHPSLDIAQWRTGDVSVLVADGSNVVVAVRDGFLVVRDGTPAGKRERRVPKVGHPLEALIVVGRHGYVTVEAMRWMHDAGVRFAVIDRELTAVTGGMFYNWRAIVGQVTNPLPAARYLIGEKIAQQADFLESDLSRADYAKIIRQSAEALREDEKITMTDVLDLERQAAIMFWKTWGEEVNIYWRPRDLSIVPLHWQVFPGRATLRNGSNNRNGASDPLNALLNYAYQIAATCAYTACRMYGLLPAAGIMHKNRDDYDAFIYDLIEPLRPWCDERVFRLVQSVGWFDRRWCHEMGDGRVLLDPPLTHVVCGWEGRMLEHLMPFARRVRELLCYGDATVTKP